ncbi:GNAT family N-acetyltransferase [Paenibacillus alginolyticus]|uniref:GNAT family N-acetyltransferase n=1 Tax=Paenibacillus alginolyticus TaxID=59839 RepID=A0ABT4GQN2_9BACL|nr:GNAT family N-acetyltransferase [Paenibacillus alginolyticus]MCY9698313.1 GNAT family N-acetyltransferase [Paenibacillus alginolyticus]MEC0148979.1 GNAT family N-acetyltransferase [Paenibacillus alginolyticus]
MSIEPTDPILYTIPESFESKRLLIRAPLWEDGLRVNEAVKESIEELRPWMPWAGNIPTIEESELSIRRSRLQFLDRTDLRLLLILKETGQLIGSSGLHRIDWQSRKFEIGYWVRTSFGNQGYITEAVEAITNYAVHELQANRIEIRCDGRNARSSRVAERLGFTLEGILRNDKCNVDGSLRDTMVFSKVRGVEF